MIPTEITHLPSKEELYDFIFTLNKGAFSFDRVLWEDSGGGLHKIVPILSKINLASIYPDKFKIDVPDTLFIRSTSVWEKGYFELKGKGMFEDAVRDRGGNIYPRSEYTEIPAPTHELEEIHRRLSSKIEVPSHLFNAFIRSDSIFHIKNVNVVSQFVDYYYTERIYDKPFVSTSE